MRLIKDGAAINPDWQLCTNPDVLDETIRQIFPLDVVLNDVADFIQPGRSIGVQIDADADIGELSALLFHIDLVAIQFSSFADGRGFSLAYRLRHSLRYENLIWASGNLIADQYPLALQCGFDAILVDELHLKRQPIEHWMAALSDAPSPYRSLSGKTQNIDVSSLTPISSINDHVISRLNKDFSNLPTEQLLDFVVNDAFDGRIALVSSFGTESAVLLHLLAQVAPLTPVLFLDTGKLFNETLNYQTELASHLNLQDVRVLKPSATSIRSNDPHGTLWQTNGSVCCDLRKIQPLQKALAGFSAWINGRKAFQSDSRSSLKIFEHVGAHIKINPLANWQPSDVQQYIQSHDLPPHPLTAKNYSSVGCAPCTTPVCAGEDFRAGRWRDSEKSECGIHLTNRQLRQAG